MPVYFQSYTPGDIAVDWVAGNLYWVDSSLAKIEAMNLDNLNRTTILQTGPNTKPSAIAVDPLKRYIRFSMGKIDCFISSYQRVSRLPM